MKIVIPILFFSGMMVSGKAQVTESFEHSGEIGISTGAATYFGSLNNTANIRHPEFATGAFYSKQFNNYIGIKIAGNYAFLAYSDQYSDNPVQRRRNLSFNTNLWELSASGVFNFFKFNPVFEEYSFTPYISLGLGAFSFDPYAYLNGQKYYLRPLGTEGQGSPLYPGLKPYSNVAICVPVGIGLKKAINQTFNIFAELNYRFTTTKYLDDVSGTYAPDAFPSNSNGSPSIGYLLQDRSWETGNGDIGVKGKQRGNGQRDAYITLEVGVSFNFQTYRCPSSH